MFTVAFWQATAERAIKTVAQGAAGALTATAVFSDINWSVVFGTAVVAGIGSVLSSIASIPLSGGGGPSLAPTAEIESNSEGETP